MDPLHPGLFKSILNDQQAASLIQKYYERNTVLFRDCPFQERQFDAQRFFEILRDTVWHGEDQIEFFPHEAEGRDPTLWGQIINKRGLLTIDQLLRLKAKKTTIYVKGLQFLDQSVRNIAREISSTGYIQCHVNGFFSPAGGKGTPTHLDSHNLLALQIHGTKRWKVDAAPCLPNVDRDLRLPDRMDLEFQKAEHYTLQPGDALFVPRGTLHAVDAPDSASLHLVVGLRSLDWYQVMISSLEEAFQSSPSLRSAVLAPGSKSFDDESTFGSVAEVLSMLVSKDTLEESAKKLMSERATATGIEEFGQLFTQDLNKLL